MEEKLLSRSEVPVNETWDLSLIFKTEEDMEAALTEALALGKHIAQNYKGKLNTAQSIADCLKEYQRYQVIADRVSAYASLSVSVDFYDNHNQSREDRVFGKFTELGSELSFVDSEIAEQDEAVLTAAAALNPDAALYLSDIIREKPHKLAPEAERVIAAYSEAIYNAPYSTYEAAKLTDMVFPDFEVDGKKYPLGYSLFEDNYEYDARTPVRRAAFKAFSEEIAKYQNVTANAYNAQCQTEKITSKLRGYKSVFDYLLFDQKVTREMYDRQIDLITERLAPHMRKYAKLIQKLYKLDKMTFADLKLPLDAGYNPTVTIDGSREYIEKGLSILGDEYLAMVKRAYKERWVDFARNRGKETGGFCSGVYKQNSYILLSWNGRMSDVFTLAHELGHAGQNMYCDENQPFFNCGMSTYIVEAPSTCNELIMAHYLLKTSDDPRFRRWVLSCMVSNTYYHNFVTHLLEAAYQREVYRIIDEGGSVQAEDLCRIKREVLEKFWGDAVEITEGAELTWMRQPHYYMGLYSYTYSAGLTVGTQAVKRMEKEGAPAVEAWKNMMKAGGTLAPAELAKIAGIDITTDAALKDTIDTIGGMIDEIISLTEEIGD